MNQYLFAFLLLASIPFLGQAQGVNEYDSNGNKHGFWCTIDTIDNKTEMLPNYIDILRVQGEYNHGERVGVWNYIDHGSSKVYHTIEYRERDTSKLYYYPNGNPESYHYTSFKSLVIEDYSRNGTIDSFTYTNYADSANQSSIRLELDSNEVRRIILFNHVGMRYEWQLDRQNQLKQIKSDTMNKKLRNQILIDNCY